MKMKVLAVAVLVAAGAAWAGDVAPTNYWAGYVVVPAAFTNAGDTGLSVSNAYVCVPLALLDGVTEANATNDVRAVVGGLLGSLYASYAASTNKPTYMGVTQDATATVSGTNVWVAMGWNVTVTKALSETIPAE